jgi:hypothetical protein
MTVSKVTGAQIRAARALLRWSASDLARQSSLGVNTIRRAEASDGTTTLTAANELAIRRALEDAGVEFTNGNRPGVRLGEAAAELARETASRSGTVAPAAQSRRAKEIKPK